MLLITLSLVAQISFYCMADIFWSASNYSEIISNYYYICLKTMTNIESVNADIQNTTFDCNMLMLGSLNLTMIIKTGNYAG